MFELLEIGNFIIRNTKKLAICEDLMVMKFN